MNNKYCFLLALLLTCLSVKSEEVPFGKGRLSTTILTRNAVRIRYTEGVTKDTLPDWVYVKHDAVSDADISVKVNSKKGTVIILDRSGRAVFTATRQQLTPSAVAGESTKEARLTILELSETKEKLLLGRQEG